MVRILGCLVSMQGDFGVVVLDVVFAMVEMGTDGPFIPENTATDVADGFVAWCMGLFLHGQGVE